MKRTIGLWKQEKRDIQTKRAKEIYKEAQNGNTANLLSLDGFGSEVEEAIRELEMDITIDVKNDQFLKLTIDGLESYYTVLYSALDGDFTVYDETLGEVVACCGKYGNADYVIWHEIAQINNKPTKENLKAEFQKLNDDNPFMILEGPDGFMQTAYEQDAYYVEWNKGGIEMHYTIQEPMPLDEVIAIFETFLDNKTSEIEKLEWIQLIFDEDEDEDEDEDGCGCGHDHGEEGGCGDDCTCGDDCSCDDDDDASGCSCGDK